MLYLLPVYRERGPAVPQRESFVGLNVISLVPLAASPACEEFHFVLPVDHRPARGTAGPWARARCPRRPDSLGSGRRVGAPLGVYSLPWLPLGPGGGIYLGSTHPRKCFAFALPVSLSSVVPAKAIPTDPSEENSSLRGAAAETLLSPRLGQQSSRVGRLRGAGGA